jgi:hypothetical protein
MSRWWRAYDTALNNPKLQRLPGDLFKTWFNICCIASANDGRLPKMSDLAFGLRMTEKNAALALAQLVSAGLVDKDEAGYAPHDWNEHQYKSDDVTSRVRKHRQKRQRNVSCNVSPSLPETPPETDTDTDTEGSVASATDGVPPSSGPPEIGKIVLRPMPDVPLPEEPLHETARERLWRIGKPALMALGVKDRHCGEMIGRWLRDAGDHHDRVLGAILRAHEMAPTAPIPWITASLKPDKANGKTHNLVEAAAALTRQLRAAELSSGANPAEPCFGAADDHAGSVSQVRAIEDRSQGLRPGDGGDAKRVPA